MTAARQGDIDCIMYFQSSEDHFFRSCEIDKLISRLWEDAHFR